MTPQAWYTLAVLAAMFVALVREWFSADVIVTTALVLLWASGVVDTSEALAGFGNAGLLTVGFLFIVSRALQDTGALARLSDVVLGNRLHRRSGMARMIFSIGTISAFMNNTPLVAIFTPAVRDWAQQRGKAPSKFLIPVSYAAILGGTCTLIGTSTNLLVSGLLEAEGYEPFSMFEISPVGVPVAIVGAVFISIFARYLLPDRRPPAQNLEIESREYSVRLQVSADCPLIGKSVEGAGLRSLKGLYLAEIERGAERIVPVRPTDLLREGDRLVLFGITDTVVELRKTRGLIPVDDADDTEQPEMLTERNLYEVVISANSPLVGSTLRSAEFRRRYDAAVIAIQRNGERLRQKLGEVQLEAGDTLMVEASPGFHDVWRHATDFYLVSEVRESERPRYALAGIGLTITGLMIAAMGFGIADPALAAATAAVLLILTRCIQVGNARNSIDVSVMVVIAAAFGISAAVTNSGLAATISSGVVGLGITSPVVMLAVVYLMTVFFTELLTNNAAAALAMPVALAVAQQVATLTGTPINPRPFAIAVAIAASMSFITPIGYQTNLMVYGPGGYRFSDFARIGVPLSIVTFIVSMLIIPWIWPLG